MDARIGHWLQGSYKNHTLIRPVVKGQEFDIDIGMYLFLHAENEGISAESSKSLHREVLEWYSSRQNESQVEPSKNSCERLSYPSSFHIDVPLYYFDEHSQTCRLATNESGWVDSDPKAFQDWFNDAVKTFTPIELAKLRRNIKYLKVWTALKGLDDGISVPSIALTVLVVQSFRDAGAEDDTFLETAAEVADYLIMHAELPSPVNGDDLLRFSDEEREVICRRASMLRDTCQHVSACKDSFEQYFLWSSVFEHIFPPYSEQYDEISQNTNLPAVTRPPRLRVRHVNKAGNIVSNDICDSIRAYRDEGLYFSIENQEDYGPGAQVHWTVRNQEKEAMWVNDLGHTSRKPKEAEQYETCAYAGIHYMECLVIDGARLAGVSVVRVNITGFSRPVRNPPRKKQFKGRR